METTKVILPPCMMPSLSDSLMHHPITEPADVTKKGCPWGKVSSVESVSFNEVMSEQLATSLQQDDEPTVTPEKLAADTVAFDNVNTDTDCSDDFLLAQMLQLEFDKEHDNNLKKEEKKYNAASKVTVSFGKYLRLPNASSSDEEEEAEDAPEQSDKRHWHNFEQAEKAFQAVGKSGVSRQGNITTTKHDLALSGRRNASKLMEFPPGFSTGDGFDMKISNYVYNTLKKHSIAEGRRGHKLHDKKEKSTAENAMDTTTRLILYKLVTGQVLDTINGCISTGKEACVYHARGPLEDSSEHSDYALKVFKTTLNEFQNRDQYIKDDHRFRDRANKQNPRKIIHLWAEKEMRNLMRIKKANIPCPEVIALRKHVLVMTFIGVDMFPAPKLKDTVLSFEDMTIAYEETVHIMKTLYSKCHLVHADLSEYNLLWHDGKVWVIDVSQAVEITHPRSLNFLARDCKNVSSFFEKRGVKNVLTTEKLFTEVCGQVLKDESDGFTY